MNSANVFELIFSLIFGALSMSYTAYSTFLARRDPERLKNFMVFTDTTNKEKYNNQVAIMASFGPFAFVFFLLLTCLGVWSAIYG